jgi:hypothetical protein
MIITEIFTLLIEGQSWQNTAIGNNSPAVKSVVLPASFRDQINSSMQGKRIKKFSVNAHVMNDGLLGQPNEISLESVNTRFSDVSGLVLLNGDSFISGLLPYPASGFTSLSCIVCFHVDNVNSIPALASLGFQLDIRFVFELETL